MADLRVDVGIIVRDSDTALAFYRDTLGLESVGDFEFPGGVMHRLTWGESLVKLTRLHEAPADSNPSGGHQAATGIRYLTLVVPDLDAVVARCEAAGYRITVPRRQVRPGVEIAFVADPDGNPVEFLQG
jgi:catechol 2,3-dioxygenase-like lactoylglutathione lyase family enzyme